VQSIIHKEHRLAGQGAILLCAILWSTSGLFIKLVDWHPMPIAGSRSILAAGVLLALRGISQAKKKRAGASTEKLISDDMPKLAAFGLCYTATMILFVIANKLTASANAILLQYTAPMWAALLGWLVLRERPRWEHWGAIVMVSAGMFLVFSGGLARGSFFGDMTALVSGITFAANSVVLRLRKDGNPADILIFSHIICAVICVPFFFLYPPSFTVDNLVKIFFMGVFQIGAASALFAYGIKRVPAVQAMLTAAIEPVLNPVWVLLITGEKPTLTVITGGSLIIAAIVFSSIIRSTSRRRN